MRQQWNQQPIPPSAIYVGSLVSCVSSGDSFLLRMHTDDGVKRTFELVKADIRVCVSVRGITITEEI